MSVIRVLVVAAVALQTALVAGVVVVAPSIRSRFMRGGMLVAVGATLAAAVAVLASLWATRAYDPPDYVLASLALAWSLGQSVGISFLVRYVRTQQGHDDELREATARLREHRDDLERSRDFYLQLFDDFPALIWRANTSAECDYFNKTWLEFRGRTTEQEWGNGWAEGVHPDDLDRCVGIWLAAFEAREAFDMEYRLANAAGEYRWIADYGRPFFDGDGTFLGYIGSCYDITKAKDQSAELAFLAEHDVLTGLANRRVLQSALDRAFARAQRGVPSSLLFMDVDHFKAINDRLGHPAGDAVLVAVAGLLAEGTRATDVAARLGGDEFALLLEMTDTEEALAIAQRLVDDVRTKVSDIGLSIGLAGMEGATDVTEVMRRADKSMYEAKNSGGGRVIVDLRAAHRNL